MQTHRCRSDVKREKDVGIVPVKRPYEKSLQTLRIANFITLDSNAYICVSLVITDSNVGMEPSKQNAAELTKSPVNQNQRDQPANDSHVTESRQFSDLWRQHKNVVFFDRSAGIGPNLILVPHTHIIDLQVCKRRQIAYFSRQNKAKNPFQIPGIASNRQAPTTSNGGVAQFDEITIQIALNP
jgi:hypothetical protein